MHLVECPRDAMQGWKNWIPTERKITYIQALLSVGFDTLDCGSFVSAKAIPQMADTAQVLRALRLENTDTKLLTIVANLRGAEEAAAFEQVTYLGFPFSISPTFQQRNTNSSLEESLGRVEDIQEICLKTGKRLVVYISMAFGNPYGDIHNADIVLHWVDKIVKLGAGIISVADTVGVATASDIGNIMQALIPAYPGIELGVHLHAARSSWKAKADAALQAGCQRFDGALKGIGGCPLAGNELVGNMDMEELISYFKSLGLAQGIHEEELLVASGMAASIFI